MSEGELLQLERARFMDVTEDIYFEIIRKKTASLIASCCAIGAASNNNSPEVIEKMRRFGELIGLAFQIRDDLFDFGDNKSGKPAGIDIKEKKLTLPLIYAFSQCSGSEVRRMKNLIRSKTPDRRKIVEVVDFINQYGGLVYARNKMTELKNQAFALLEETTQPGQKRDDLLKLVNFVIEREQ
jgi:octaprenyl-diphosphate synthase